LTHGRADGISDGVVDFQTLSSAQVSIITPFRVGISFLRWIEISIPVLHPEHLLSRIDEHKRKKGERIRALTIYNTEASTFVMFPASHSHLLTYRNRTPRSKSETSRPTIVKHSHDTSKPATNQNTQEGRPRKCIRNLYNSYPPPPQLEHFKP